MAQIKNIKKPGDLIRGARVGVAGLDKDGNVVGTGIDAGDLASWPEGAKIGDILTWGGETGPEWNTPESSAVYNHYLFIDFGNDYGTFVINSSSGTPFNADSLVEVLNSNGIDGSAKNKKIWGYVHISSTDLGSMYLSEYATKKVALQRGTNGSISLYEMIDSRIYDTVVSV